MNKKYKPIGLKNLNLNCYMNSLIQCLFYCKEFRKKMLEIKPNDSQPLCKILKKLMQDLQSSEENNISPKDLKKFISNNNELFEPGKQADANDLLEYIFNTIIYELKNEDSFSGTVHYEERIDNKLAMFNETKNEIDNSILINELFVGFYEKEFYCEKNHKKYAFQGEYRIVFPLEEISQNYRSTKILNINDCFKYIYQRSQKETEKCSGCGGKTFIKEKIYQAPKILIILLDRGANKVCDRRVEFNDYLNIGDYIDEDEKNKFSNEYQLIGVSTHLGQTGNYGHYISFCLGNDNNYYCFDDEKSFMIKENNLKKTLNEGSPYLLFYQRKEKNSQKQTNTDNFRNNLPKINNKLKKNIPYLKKNITVDPKQLIRERIGALINKNGFTNASYSNNFVRWVNLKNSYFIDITFEQNKINVVFSKKNNIYYYYFSIKNSSIQIPINRQEQINWSMDWKNEENDVYCFIIIFEDYFNSYFTN